MTICRTANIPSSDIRCDNKSLNAEGFEDLDSSHHEPGPSDERGVVRKYPLGDVASNSGALNVDNDIVGVTPRHPGLSPNDARVATRKLWWMTRSWITRHQMLIVTSTLVHSILRSMTLGTVMSRMSAPTSALP